MVLRFENIRFNERSNHDEIILFITAWSQCRFGISTILKCPFRCFENSKKIVINGFKWIKWLIFKILNSSSYFFLFPFGPLQSIWSKSIHFGSNGPRWTKANELDQNGSKLTKEIDLGQFRPTWTELMQVNLSRPNKPK